MRDFESNRTQIMNSIENRVRQSYNSGYDMGFKDGYYKGLEEAWECAKKIYHMSAEKVIATFGSCSNWVDFTAEEAIEKIREYENKVNEPDKEIRVGDEIVYETGAKSVVSRIRDDFCYCIDGVGYPRERCEKTGRHFPQIEEVLKATEGAAE